MSKRTLPRERTSIVEHGDGYHINYQREDGYNAMIDSPYFSAICLGYFDTKDAARLAISQYTIEHAAELALEVAVEGLDRTARELDGGADDIELAANGMRRASEDEAGWYVTTSRGKVWATDDFSTSRWGSARVNWNS